MTDEDKLSQFAAMVQHMRAAQIAYFKTRGRLDDCKKVERAVDRWLEEYAETRAGQGKLF